MIGVCRYGESMKYRNNEDDYRDGLYPEDDEAVHDGYGEDGTEAYETDETELPEDTDYISDVNT